MQKKFLSVDFGRCPRVNCEGQPALPIGLSDIARSALAKLFCPRCNDVFYPPNTKHSRTFRPPPPSFFVNMQDWMALFLEPLSLTFFCRLSPSIFLENLRTSYPVPFLISTSPRFQALFSVCQETIRPTNLRFQDT